MPGCLHPDHEGYFATPAAYMDWYRRAGPLRSDASAPTVAVRPAVARPVWLPRAPCMRGGSFTPGAPHRQRCDAAAAESPGQVAAVVERPRVRRAAGSPVPQARHHQPAVHCAAGALPGGRRRAARTHLHQRRRGGARARRSLERVLSDWCIVERVLDPSAQSKRVMSHHRHAL